jgi:hypothetical protein
MRLHGTILRLWIVGTFVLGAAVFCGGWKWGATIH